MKFLKAAFSLVLLSTCMTGLAGNQFLADRHIARSMTCESCHQKGLAVKAPASEQCFACHGNYEQLRKKTASPKKMNPHDTHLGDLECNGCHRAHAAPVPMCVECHGEEMAKELNLK